MPSKNYITDFDSSKIAKLFLFEERIKLKAGVTHIQLLAHSKQLLDSAYQRVMANAKLADNAKLIDGLPCLISAYAKSEPGKSEYPTCTYTFSIHGKKGSIKLKLACHMVVMMKVRNGVAWDSNKLNVSHNCHNTLCNRDTHLSLMTPKENNAKNIHCIGLAMCPRCAVTMKICQHTTPCLGIIKTVCSNCIKLNSKMEED